MVILHLYHRVGPSAQLYKDAQAQNIGFSKVISMGNKVDMDESDVL